MKALELARRINEQVDKMVEQLRGWGALPAQNPVHQLLLEASERKWINLAERNLEGDFLREILQDLAAGELNEQPLPEDQAEVTLLILPIEEGSAYRLPADPREAADQLAEDYVLKMMDRTLDYVRTPEE